MVSFSTLLSAFILGILTSISPCPLATNIVALSYISKKITHPFIVFISGVAYSLGRMTLYITLSIIIIYGLTDLPWLSNTLQTNLPKIIGPILIITGTFILQLIPINIPSFTPSEKTLKLFEKSGIVGSFLLGFILALSFCPNSAALFFGGVVPIATSLKSPVIIPSIYGISTGLPVLTIAVIASTGTSKLASFFNTISIVEVWMNRVVGSVFILVGMYFSLKYIFRIELPF